MPESAALRYRHAHVLKRIELRDEWARRTWYVCVRRLEDLPSYAQDLVAGLLSVPRTDAPQSRKAAAGSRKKAGVVRASAGQPAGHGFPPARE